MSAPERIRTSRLTLERWTVGHDVYGGRRRGGLSDIVAVTVDGLRVVHTGDVGELPDQTFLEAVIGPGIDVLDREPPVGGFVGLK